MRLGTLQTNKELPTISPYVKFIHGNKVINTSVYSVCSQCYFFLEQKIIDPISSTSLINCAIMVCIVVYKTIFTKHQKNCS